MIERKLANARGWLIAGRLNKRRKQVYKTIDGGTKWTRVSGAFSGAKAFTCIRFLGKDAGFAFYEDSRGRPYMLYTTNGGAGWQKLSIPASVQACDAVNGDLICTALNAQRGFMVLRVHPLRQ